MESALQASAIPAPLRLSLEGIPKVVAEAWRVRRAGRTAEARDLFARVIAVLEATLPKVQANRSDAAPPKRRLGIPGASLARSRSGATITIQSLHGIVVADGRTHELRGFHEDSGDRVRFLDDSELFWTAGQTVSLYDPKRGERIAQCETFGSVLAIAPDGSLIAHVVVSEARSIVKLHLVATGQDQELVRADQESAVSQLGPHRARGSINREDGCALKGVSLAHCGRVHSCFEHSLSR